MNLSSIFPSLKKYLGGTGETKKQPKEHERKVPKYISAIEKKNRIKPGSK